MTDLTPEQRNRAAVHKAMEIIVENEITGVSEWRYNLTDRLTEAALSALRAATPGDGLDALAAALRDWLDSHGEADIEERLAEAAKDWLERRAATEQGERTHE